MSEAPVESRRRVLTLIYPNDAELAGTPALRREALPEEAQRPAQHVAGKRSLKAMALLQRLYGAIYFILYTLCFVLCTLYFILHLSMDRTSLPNGEVSQRPWQMQGASAHLVLEELRLAHLACTRARAVGQRLRQPCWMQPCAIAGALERRREMLARLVAEEISSSDSLVDRPLGLLAPI